VEERRDCDGGVFLFTGPGFINWHGVAYIPAGKGAPPRNYPRHLYGDWYLFTWHF
jgi:hypothetical protein